MRSVRLGSESSRSVHSAARDGLSCRGPGDHRGDNRGAPARNFDRDQSIAMAVQPENHTKPRQRKFVTDLPTPRRAAS